MNPFDFQVSKIIHDERLQHSAYLRTLNTNGTSSASFAERTMRKLGQSVASLMKMINHHAQPAAAKSVSHLR
jgi:hypothetical protein